MASLPQPDASTIRRYLLGELSEAEALSLEERYFADPEAFEQVWAVENELVDDYVAGRLGAEERDQFERHYLSSPRHRERVAAAKALRGAPPRRSQRLAWWAVAAVLPLLVGVLWLLKERPPDRPRVVEASPTPTPLPSAVTPTASPTPIVRSPVVVAFALSPILLRGGKEQPRLRVPNGTDEVVLHLGGEPSVASRLRFVLRAVDGGVVSSGRAEPGPRGQPGQVASARIPAARLPPGDYILILSAAGDDEPLNQYFFRITR
jgi:hypothetical protein